MGIQYDNRLHLAILFASPLGFINSDKVFETLESIGFENDIGQILKSL